MSECDITPERIAQHYARMASLAVDLLQLTQSLRYHAPSEQTNVAIARITQEIKRHHLHDFGIALEWPKGKTE